MTLLLCTCFCLVLRETSPVGSDKKPVLVVTRRLRKVVAFMNSFRVKFSRVYFTSARIRNERFMAFAMIWPSLFVCDTVRTCSPFRTGCVVVVCDRGTCLSSEINEHGPWAC